MKKLYYSLLFMRINMVQDRINNRPRKRLDFLTPVEFVKQKYGDNKTILNLLRYKFEFCACKKC